MHFRFYTRADTGLVDRLDPNSEFWRSCTKFDMSQSDQRYQLVSPIKKNFGEKHRVTDNYITVVRRRLGLPVFQISLEILSSFLLGLLLSG